MRKIIWLLFGILIFTACNTMNSPTKKTEEYLTKYQSLSDDVMSDLELSVEGENLGSTNSKTYKDVITRQYQNLKYEITNETVNGDEAIVTAKITIFDLYKSMKKSKTYLETNRTQFEDNGIYNQESFMVYELDDMLKTNETIDYTIDFYLEKVDNNWQLKPLSETTKEKIHGVYNYETEQ